MNCGYSKEILALYIEDDLPTDDAVNQVESHVACCILCQRYCDQLRQAQSLIRSRFNLAQRDAVSQESLTSVRRNVMSQIDSAARSLGWAVRLERFFMLGLRSQRYAIACFAFLAIVSVSLLGQIRYAKTGAAVFIADNTMLLPNGYREWVFVGSSFGLGYSPKSPADMYHNVYINPAAYREYVHSGKFPDGTVMVLEMLSAEKKDDAELSGSYEKNFMGVEVSVKDSSRFAGGWGFYNFTDDNGNVKPQAEQVPETAACLSCHRDKAATDHVFTQFYPVLRNIGSRGAI
jgi:hypothetical protein